MPSAGGKPSRSWALRALPYRASEMVVDFQHHYTPPELMETGKSDGSLRLDENGNPNYRFNPLLADLPAHVRMMDKAGIDVAVLSCGSGFDQPNLATCRLINDRMHPAERDHPGRFIGLAHVPAFNFRETETQLKRCAVELGFPGIVIASEVQGQPLDAPSLRPFGRAAAALGLYVFIHPPPQMIGWAYMDADDLWRMLGWEFSLMVATVRLINSGLLDELPSLRFTSHISAAASLVTSHASVGSRIVRKVALRKFPGILGCHESRSIIICSIDCFTIALAGQAPTMPPSEAPSGCVLASRNCRPRKSYSQPTILRR